MIAGPSATGTATAGVPRSQQLPPVSGPRVPPGPNLPEVPSTAPRARAGEPLPSLAELLNRPVNPNQLPPEIMTSTVPVASAALEV